MAKYIYLTILLLIVGLLTTAIIAIKRASHYHELYDIEVANVRAYETENSDLKNQRQMFELSLAQLQGSKDTLTQKMLETAKELKIKEKKIQQLQYQASFATKIDTVVFYKKDSTLTKDTIFNDRISRIDTCVSDEWYNMCLTLQYPSTIITNPSFKSEKTIVVSKKREYVKPPHKCFLVRWFQKKQTVIVVDIVEKNPYIENKESRFINIVKK